MSNEENNLGPDELERLSILMEEMAEAIQIVGKIQRHGYESYNPSDPAFSNTDLLEKELGHVQHAISSMVANNDIDAKNMEIAKCEKKESIKQYLHFAHSIY